MLTSPACLLADVDECALGTACGPNTVCSNSAGSYACACKPGFVLVGNDLKTDGCAGEQSVGVIRMLAALRFLDRRKTRNINSGSCGVIDVCCLFCPDPVQITNAEQKSHRLYAWKTVWLRSTNPPPINCSVLACRLYVIPLVASHTSYLQYHLVQK
jgi:hypothetical protein